MIRVRRHEREIRPGKVVTVRQHEREGGAPDGMVQRPEGARGWAVPPPGESAAPVDDDWWASDEPDAGDPETDEATSDLPEDDDPQLTSMKAEMREWRSRPEPVASPAAPMSPAKAKLLGCDTPEGLAKFNRLRAYREAGYDGPLDQDNRIPDPDDPANEWMIGTLAAMQK